MDNLNTSENDSGPEEGQYVRGHPQRRFGDLREMLNHKRQQSHEGKNNGPPPDPKNNFLSDPLRDNEQDSNNIPISDNIDNARFSTTYNQPHFQTRVSRGSRGRFGSSNRGDRRSQYGSKRDEEWKYERNKIDQDRINRQRSDDGGWTREWDAGKEEIPANTNRGRRDQNVHHKKYDNSSRSDKQHWPDNQRSEHYSRSDTYSKSDNFRSTHQSRSGRPTRSDNQSRFDNQPRFATNDSTIENHPFRSDNLNVDQEPDPESKKYQRRSNPKFNRDQEDLNTPKSAYDQQDPNINPRSTRANKNPGAELDQQDPNDSRSPRKHLDRSNQNTDQQDLNTNFRSQRKYDRSNQNPGTQHDQESDQRPRKYFDRSIQNSEQHDSSNTIAPRKYQDRSNQNARSDFDQQPDHRSSRKYQDRSNQNPDLQDPKTNRSPKRYQDISNQNPRSDLDQQADHRSSRKYQDRSNQNFDQQDPNTNRSPRRYQDRSNQKPRSDLDQQSDHRSSRKYQDRSNQNPDQQDPNTMLRSPKKYQDRSNQDSNNTRAPRKYYSGKFNPNPNPDQVTNSTVGSPRQYNSGKSNRGSNQYRPPHRFNPNYRGSKSYSKRRNINPVNITVEYSVDTGERKCSYDTIKTEKGTGKLKENAEPVSQKLKEEDNWAAVPQHQEEENWDEYDYNEECEANLQSPEAPGQDDFDEYEPDLDEDFERIAEKVNPESNEVDLMSEMKKAEELTLHDYEEDVDVETENISELKKDDLIQIGELKQCVSKLKEMLGSESGIDSKQDGSKKVDTHSEEYESKQNKEIDEQLKIDNADIDKDVQTSKHDKELKNSKQIEQLDLKQETDLEKTKHVDIKEEPKPKETKQLKSNNSKQEKKIATQDIKKDLKPKEVKDIAKNSKQDVKKNGKKDTAEAKKSVDKLKKSKVDEVKNVDSNLDEIEMHVGSKGEENEETKIVEEI